MHNWMAVESSGSGVAAGACWNCVAGLQQASLQHDTEVNMLHSILPHRWDDLHAEAQSPLKAPLQQGHSSVFSPMDDTPLITYKRE